MKIEVKIFYGRIKSKVSGNKERAQKAVDMTVIKDSSRFVPFQTGTLEKSALESSRIGTGLVVYNTPYAKRSTTGSLSMGRTSTRRRRGYGLKRRRLRI